MQTIFGIEVTEFIFWSLFVLLTIGEIIVVLVLKYHKVNPSEIMALPALEQKILHLLSKKQREVRELASACKKSAEEVSGALAAIKENGYIASKKDKPGDIIQLSEKGRRVMEEYAKLETGVRIRDWVEPAFEAIIIAIVIRTLFIQAFRIPTSSMEDTLLISDQIIANKFIYGTTVPWEKNNKLFKFTKPKRGDVIIFRYPEDPKLMFIKRCMGLPGDTLEMKDKILYINGKKMDEPYTYHKDMRIFPAQYAPRDNWGPIKVPEGCFWAMGDNRDFSSDSRYWGFLPFSNLRGKAWVVYWPPSRWRAVKHIKIDAPEPAK